MSSTWIGLIAGGVVGAAFGFVLSKKLTGHGDLGVSVAALGAGALIGGAIAAPKPSTEQATNEPTPTS